ncbi:MAG: phosphodiester glycosidase family protein [Candidatus Sericytochromatia bacterium]|nr:phosphodiester glycosidase family protein [Candidatus Sericytochromatia bacterium]
MSPTQPVLDSRTEFQSFLGPARTWRRVGTLVVALVITMGGNVIPPLTPPAAARQKTVSPVSIDSRKTKIVLPLRNAHINKKVARVTNWSLEATGVGLSSAGPVYERDIHQGALHHLRIHTFENKVYLKADWRYAAPVEVNRTSRGLEITFFHRKATPAFRAVAPGVALWEGQRWTSRGPMRVRALELDPQQVTLEPAIASAGSKRMGLSKVSQFGHWHGAIAAVNGSYFSPATGEPQGAVVLDRQLVSRTMMDRPAVWFNLDGGIDIHSAKPRSSVVLEDGTRLRCMGVNESAKRNRLTLYSSHYGLRSRTIADPSRCEMAVNAGGRVVNVGNGNLEIPSGGFVLSGQGTAATQMKRLIGHGQVLRIDHTLPVNAQHALGAGPTLIQAGRINVLAKQQKFKADVAYGRAPRTAIGITRNKKYMLVTIDGRQPGYSVGATLQELAHVLKDLGNIEAINLDGGGSTTMWLRGKVIGSPSEGRERPVSTALLVLPRREPPVAAVSPTLANLVTSWLTD